MDKLYKALIFDNQLALSVLDTTDMVNKAIEIHGLSPVCAAALGRTMTACTYMASGLKNIQDKLYVTVAGDGPIGKITVCGNGKLYMRGSVLNEKVDIPLKKNGKLDVGGAVGKGRLTVVKSMGLKEPYSGSSELVSGEIAEDFTSYYAYSEQKPIAMALGVKIGTDCKCIGSGGVIIEALPFADIENIKKAESVINSLTDISSQIAETGIDGIIEKYFGKIEYAEYRPKYKCICSRINTENILKTIPKSELYDIIEKDGKISVDCEFCKKKYIFTKEDVDALN